MRARRLFRPVCFSTAAQNADPSHHRYLDRCTHSTSFVSRRIEDLGAGLSVFDARATHCRLKTSRIGSPRGEQQARPDQLFGRRLRRSGSLAARISVTTAGAAIARGVLPRGAVLCGALARGVPGRGVPGRGALAREAHVGDAFRRDVVARWVPAGWATPCRLRLYYGAADEYSLLGQPAASVG